MINKIFMLVVAVTMTVAIGASPVFAQSGPQPVYVDPSRTNANEDGTQANPYNSRDEAKAFAQSYPNGGWLYVRNQDGTWPTAPIYVPPVRPAPGGEPLPAFALYILIALLSIILVLGGLYLQKRSRQILVKSSR